MTIKLTRIAHVSRYDIVWSNRRYVKRGSENEQEQKEFEEKYTSDLL